MLLVESESLLRAFNFVWIRRFGDCLLLGFYRGIKITPLRVSRGQSIDVTPIVPRGKVASRFAIYNGLLTVAKSWIRTRCSKPGAGTFR